MYLDLGRLDFSPSIVEFLEQLLNFIPVLYVVLFLYQ